MLTNNTNAPIANRIRPPTMTPICTEEESLTTKKGYLMSDHAVVAGTFTFKAIGTQKTTFFSILLFKCKMDSKMSYIKERLYSNVMIIDWVLDS